jgi:hypothetical protein
MVDAFASQTSQEKDAINVLQDSTITQNAYVNTFIKYFLIKYALCLFCLLSLQHVIVILMVQLVSTALKNLLVVTAYASAHVNQTEWVQSVTNVLMDTLSK